MKPLFVILGKSGSGKDFLVDTLCTQYPDRFNKVISYTTRPPRFKGEKTHTFITDKEYTELKNIVANTVFNGYSYCATKEQIDNSNIYIVDINGLKTLKKKYITERPIYIFEIQASLYTRFCRMLKRDNFIKATSRIFNDALVFRDLKKIQPFEGDFKEIQPFVIYNNKNNKNGYQELQQMICLLEIKHFDGGH